MATKPHQAKAELIAKVLAHARGKFRGDQAAQVEAFVGQYYRRVAPEDLAPKRVIDLYGAAGHWQLASQRTPGTPRIRVYIPDFEEHGWHRPTPSSTSSPTTCRSSSTR